MLTQNSQNTVICGSFNSVNSKTLNIISISTDNINEPQYKVILNAYGKHLKKYIHEVQYTLFTKAGMKTEHFSNSLSILTEMKLQDLKHKVYSFIIPYSLIRINCVFEHVNSLIRINCVCVCTDGWSNRKSMEFRINRSVTEAPFLVLLLSLIVYVPLGTSLNLPPVYFSENEVVIFILHSAVSIK